MSEEVILPSADGRATTQSKVRPLPLKATDGIAVIDYLRGIAALGVALFHVRVPLWVGWREIEAHPERYSWLERAVAWLSTPTPFMGSFVMLFFVISGFCVHLPQARQDAPLALRAYFWRRFFRIYPPYFAAVLLSVLVFLIPGENTGWSQMDGRHVLASLAMVQNYTVGGGGEGGQLATNPALWSLPVEMELYLLYPLLLVGARRFGWVAMLAGVAVVSVSAVAAGAAGAVWITGNFAMYWIIWCAGAWLAEQWSRGTLRTPPWWCAVAAAVAIVAGLGSTAGFFALTAAPLCYGMFYAWLVWMLVSRPALCSKVPGTVAVALRGLGQVSYSFYLIHFPIFIVMGAAWVSVFGSKPGSFGVALAAVAISGVFVAVFYRFVEQPSHRWARLARKSPKPEVAVRAAI